MNIHELACNIVREYMMAQIKDPRSEFWDAVEDDPDIEGLTTDEYDDLLDDILDVKIAVS